MAMGILNKLRDYFYRRDRRCRECGVALVGMQEYTCSDNCQVEAEWWDAIK